MSETRIVEATGISGASPNCPECATLMDKYDDKHYRCGKCGLVLTKKEIVDLNQNAAKQ